MTLLGLDVGAQRVGVSLARLDVAIPQPLTTLDATDSIHDRIAGLVDEHQSAAIVVGWPRGLAGQSTGQTQTVESFVEALRQVVDVPVHLQDEALTSQKAEAELSARRKPFTREDIDALAATYILEDYIADAGAGGLVAGHV